MIDENGKDSFLPEAKDTTSPSTVLGPEDSKILNVQSCELIKQIIAEQDVEKTKDLTYLFNQNQNKKTLVRINKLNELLDVITDQAIDRFSKHSDEITTKEIMDSLKTVQDSIDRGNQQVAGVQEAPLIQINQQNNEVTFGEEGTSLNKESRERVKAAVMAMLGQFGSKANNATVSSAQDLTGNIQTNLTEELKEDD